MAYEDKNVEELIRLNIALTKENNQLLKKMRRDAFIGKIFKALVLAAMIIIPWYVYVTYLQPTLQQVQEVYTEIEGDINAFRQFQESMPAMPAWAQKLLEKGVQEASSSQDTKGIAD